MLPIHFGAWQAVYGWFRELARRFLFQTILDGIRKRWPWIKHLFADSAYDRLKVMDKASYLDFAVEVARRCDNQKGFKALPCR